MERKVFLAAILSMLVLLGYNYFIAKVYRLEKPAVSTKESLPQKIPSIIAPQEIKPKSKLPSSISLEHNVLENGDLKLVFTNLGGNLQEVYLKRFQHKFYETSILSLEEFEDLPFQLIVNKEDRLVYVYEDNLRKISKAFFLSNNSLDFELGIQNLSAQPNNFNLKLDYFSLNLHSTQSNFQKNKNFLELSISLPDKILRNNITRVAAKNFLLTQQKFNWLGLRERYFCSIFKPNTGPLGYYTQLIDNESVTVGMPIQILNLAPQTLANFKAKLYFGPQETQLLNSIDKDFGQIVNFGAFDPISKLLLSLLRWLHKFLPNWGLCILGVSLILFFCLYPLTFKSLKSMKAMQVLQPEIERLRKELKDQPQKLNREIMELYKKNKVNPFGGCLPMFLQIPIFFALYQALLRSLDLRGAKFLWIKDLSEPDRLFTFESNLPLLGNEINLLPILMAIIMFFQQRLSSQSSAAVNPEQQKMMTIFFPILFGIMFYHVPSGLVFYWFVYSSLSLIVQWKQTAKV
ncbi:MAG: membrane protein insertase YidC [Candidatus Omnitrophota bacterium]|nr:membrane protein insertase YidC [Candidatus Omnitrophota bacterium]